MMKELKLDLNGVQSEDDFHDRATATFDFPAYYGRNRDAFWDCITDFVDPTTVRVCNLDTVPDAIKPRLVDYIEMLRTYETESDGKFSVQIDAATPPTPDS
ncbi:MAG: barstar family protein [Verrucomicrobiota bacterium]|jgi:ribonuclease inhibitor